MKVITLADVQAMAEGMRRPYQANYFAMYSSVYGGIVTDPLLMTVPIDDHMVHRGDAVFETFKCVNGNIYNMKAHLDRLAHSAAGLGVALPLGVDEIGRVVVETIRVGGRRDGLVRLYVSRGPGSFDVNPYDCPKTQLYVVITSLKKPFMELHPEGARVATSKVQVKPPFYANIKCCNYLPNVLMKKEAVDQGVDFVVAFDEKGFMAEGATENVGIVSRKDELLFPNPDAILTGTTMVRVMELADGLVQAGELRRTAHADISRQDVADAAEVLIVGTSPNVVQVREFDGKPVNGGRPGPIFQRLSRLLLDDILHNPKMLTPVPGLAE